jgi:4-amino-4-deoxy-L-arabinose transferase-like glycosyltransferase
MSIAAARRPVARLAVPRRLRARRIPRAGLVCALVAFLNAACWSVITPPFQAPDEPSHFAYVQLLAETGRLPTSSRFAFSQEEEAALADLRQSQVRWHPEVETISSASALQRLRGDLASPLSRVGVGDAGAATGEPPAYYALETIPYYLGSGGTLLGQLELMRLVSALMGGLTALFCYLFVRESLPAAPWAWTVGGLAVALFPLLGFTSGAVTPDAMLFAVSAATFFCLARAFRRGLTRRRALAIGALAALGLLTKLNFVGLLPGVLLALAVLAFRGVRPRTGAHRSRRVLGSAALASAIALSPLCVYALHNLSQGHALFGRLSASVHHSTASQSLIGEASYVWQLYLPRLPGMARYFPGLFPTRELWFDRAVGLYGWLDTAFPPWVYDFALVAAGLVAALAVAASIDNRRALRRRVPELLVYLVMAAGVLVLVGVSSRMAETVEGTSFAQPRYLLPMLALFGAALALAARGARRWGPAIGCLIVLLVLAHDLFSQLQVIARFYG